MAEWNEAAGGGEDDSQCAAFVAQLLLLAEGPAAGRLGIDNSALKVAGGRPALGGDLKFRKLEPGRDRAAAQGV